MSKLKKAFPLAPAKLNAANSKEKLKISIAQDITGSDNLGYSKNMKE
jgi:hypothetical protein